MNSSTPVTTHSAIVCAVPTASADPAIAAASTHRLARVTGSNPPSHGGCDGATDRRQRTSCPDGPTQARSFVERGDELLEQVGGEPAAGAETLHVRADRGHNPEHLRAAKQTERACDPQPDR